jgi:hypothetical protein
MLIGEVISCAPDQLCNTYSEEGYAVTVAILPSLYCLVTGKTVPPSDGFAEVVNVYIIGSLEQDTINKTDNSRRNFLILNFY